MKTATAQAGQSDPTGFFICRCTNPAADRVPVNKKSKNNHKKIRHHRKCGQIADAKEEIKTLKN